MAKEALRDLLAVQNRQISIENIQKTVADYYKIRISDMHSKKRSRAVARPRQVAMALAKELTQLSLPEIGSNFGGRDHTTVLHACRQIAEAARDASRSSTTTSISCCRCCATDRSAASGGRRTARRSLRPCPAPFGLENCRFSVYNLWITPDLPNGQNSPQTIHRPPRGYPQRCTSSNPLIAKRFSRLSRIRPRSY